MAIPELPIRDHPALFRGETHGIVDFSEDVSSKDLVAAAEEGYDSVELAKRYTTATMGPAQGKLETVNAVAVLAEANGRTIEETGTTVWRPPYAPDHPRRPGRTRLRARALLPHAAVARGARRAARSSPAPGSGPTTTATPRPRSGNVRENVGIIDVTPLGKLDLRGPDVPKLLNLLYVNKWGKLDVGGVRYGVMCAEDGVVLDDGVTGRLGQEHYLMSTTSSGAASAWEWVENWLQTEHPEWQVHVTPVTTGVREHQRRRAEVPRVAPAPDRGRRPRARGLPLHAGSRGTVAGVDGCFMWRIGFTGELSYELHVPAAYGLHVWEALMQRGADLGIRPFGVEAQRILRLEKGHFIVGQDTDGLTRPFAVGLGA